MICKTPAHVLSLFRAVSDRFGRARNGSFATHFAILSIPLVMSVGLAVDTSIGILERGEIKKALDSAVLAGLSATIEDLGRVVPGLTRDSDSIGKAREEYARHYLEANFSEYYRLTKVEMDFDDVNLSGFAQLPGKPEIFGGLGVPVLIPSAKSAATLARTDVVSCVHASNPDQDLALILNSKPKSGDTYIGASLYTSGCGTYVNSKAVAAVLLKAGTFSSTYNCFVGGVVGGSPGDLTTTPIAPCKPISDPFSTYTVNIPVGCDHTAPVTIGGAGLVTVSPGRFCGGLAVSGTNVVFKPGNYFVSGGDLTVTADDKIVGKGVSFHVDGGYFQFVADQVELKATSTGPIKSFVAFGKPGVGAPVDADKKTKKKKKKAAQNLIRGEQRIYVEGIVYASSSHLEIRWNRPASISSPLWTAPVSPFAAFIADTLDFHGYSQWGFGYDPKDTDLTLPDVLINEISAFPMLIY